MKDIRKVLLEEIKLSVQVRATELIQLAEEHRNGKSTCTDYSLTVEEIAWKLIDDARVQE